MSKKIIGTTVTTPIRIPKTVPGGSASGSSVFVSDNAIGEAEAIEVDGNAYNGFVDFTARNFIESHEECGGIVCMKDIDDVLNAGSGRPVANKTVTNKFNELEDRISNLSASGGSVTTIKGDSIKIEDSGDGTVKFTTYECAHNYIAVVTAPTCKDRGYTTYTCTKCGNSYVDEDSYTEPHNIHTYDNGQDTTCNVCGHVREVVQCEHNYTSDVTPPTCTEAGYTTYTCTKCGDSYRVNTNAALGHSEVTIPGKAATCTETGLTDGTKCSVCQAIIKAQQTIPAKGHTYDAGVVTDPDCENDGYTTYTCTVCGHIHVADNVPATGHSYDNALDEECNVCGHIREIITETATAESTANELGKNFLALSADTLPYADDKTDLTVYDTTASKIMRYGSKNWFPMSALTTTSDGRLTVGRDIDLNAVGAVDGSFVWETDFYDKNGNKVKDTGEEMTSFTVDTAKCIAVKHNATITFPMELPAGYYYISAQVVKLGNPNKYPGIYLKNKSGGNANAEGTYNGQAAGMTLGVGTYGQNGRHGCCYKVTEPIRSVQIFSADNNNNSGESLAGGNITVLQNFQILYSDVSLHETGNAEERRYGYAGDYDGVVYYIGEGLPEFKNGTTLVAEGGVAFSVSHEYVVTPATYSLRRTVTPEAADYEEYNCDLQALVINGRGYTSFRDKTARRLVTEEATRLEKAIDAEATERAKDISRVEGLIAQGGGGTSQTTDLHDYLIAEADRVTNEVINTGLESDLSFLAFADPHSFDEYKYRKYANIMENGGLDFMLGLGDYNKYHTGKVPKNTVIGSMHQMLYASGKGANCFYAAGNHDVFTSNVEYGIDFDTTLTKKEQHKLLCSHLNGVVTFDENDPYGCHYYVDYEASKIRLVVLNSSDLWKDDGSIVTGTKYAAISLLQGQMDWFTSTALNFEGKTGWSVMVALHTYKIAEEDYLLHKILQALEKGTTFSYNDKWLNITTEKANFVGKKAEVIGIFYGHAHNDSNEFQYGINSIQIRCDNADKHDVYFAPVNGTVEKGKLYYFEAENGNKWSFTINNDAVSKACYFQYNKYLQGKDQIEIWLLDENLNQVWFGYPSRAKYESGGTLIASDYEPRRIEGTASWESCAVININKDARTITVVPYGLCDERVIQY